MKRVFSVMLLLALCLGMFMIPVSAEETSRTVTKVNSDGSYVVEVITEEATNTRATVKRGTKTATYYTSSNEAIFSVKVTGVFTYTGSSATADSSSATVTLHTSDAIYVTKSAYTSGRTAYASGTVKYYGLNYTQDVSLSCSNTGVLS